jgi:hypothetical protein
MTTWKRSFYGTNSASGKVLRKIMRERFWVPQEWLMNQGPILLTIKTMGLESRRPV